MKKIIISMFIIVLLTQFCFADIELNATLITPDDIYANIFCMNGGNCNVQVDGTDYSQRLNEVRGSMYGRYEINKFFARAISILKGTYKYAQSDEDVQMGYTLESYFASDYDLMYAYTMLSHRIETLEYLYKTQSEANNQTNYCKGVEHVAIKYNLTGVTCDDTTLIMDGDYMMSITTFDKEIEINEVDNLSNNEVNNLSNNSKGTYSKLALQKYQELCDLGLKKYCMIIENN